MYKRGKIWYFSIGGTPHSSGTEVKKDAETLRRKLERDHWERSTGLYVKTWEEACRDWLNLHQHLDSYSQLRAHAAWWLPHLQGRKLNAIGKELVHDIITAHRPVNIEGKSKKNSTANIYVDFVARVLRAEGQTPKFVRYKKQGQSTRWLRPDEWQQLMPNMGTDLLDLGMFALATGLRSMNCMRFEWAWVHGDKAYLPPEVTKTDKPYSIPLNKTAQSIIERRRNATVRSLISHKYVFTNNGRQWAKPTLRVALIRAQEASGIDPMTFHTFRHTFASWLAQKGVSDAIRKRLGCWTTGEGASGGYLHFDVEPLREYAEKLDPILNPISVENKVSGNQSSISA